VKSSEFLVVEDDASDLLSLTGHELNNVLGEASLEKNLVNEPVGGNRRRRGLPEDDVTHQSGRTGQIATDSGEVEGADSVDETLQRTVLEAAGMIVSNLDLSNPKFSRIYSLPHTRGMVNRLLSIKLLGVLHTEAEEVNELGSRVNLSLPGVLALAVHGQSHDIVAVLG
jgi:hypothetical protein